MDHSSNLGIWFLVLMILSILHYFMETWLWYIKYDKYRHIFWKPEVLKTPCFYIFPNPRIDGWDYHDFGPDLYIFNYQSFGRWRQKIKP